ncbi:pyrroline-5-carboxylate reductase [Vineibacter terrae]|uniref:pyrroline-5-carboxylate reductase n=1 Tax=Vineibacter terrae TaxID=2586908 RepID=UPI002E35E82C|nr:pyrroline-5-carboxylate reductase [Vineibacter terrae]HEX2891805.1 pyrroline-5-carboxylate reductase [Vineibacter terrae]
MAGRGKLLLVGCGKMGGAMLEGWLEQGLKPADLAVIEPGEASRPKIDGAAVVAAVDALPAGFVPDIAVLAVKPQTMNDVLPGLRRLAGDATTFLSIAAGKTIGYFRAGLGEHARIVRAMPNTPAAVRRGVTVCVAGPGVSDPAKARCTELLSAVGDVLWTQDEGVMDAVTAVSGSGPAYVFLLVEAMAEAGVKAGLPADMAMTLARATVAGSGELLRRSSEPAAQLRVNVTSPGGTTAEALKILMSDIGIQPLFDSAIAAAARRSRELAG